MTDTVLVLGGTGKTGRRLVPLLSRRDVDVRVASRQPDDGRTLFDWDRPDTHARALAGVDAVYLVVAEMVADPSPQTGPFLEQAAEAGVGRVVLLSALGVEVDRGQPEAGLRKVERQVISSGLDWTILRPSAFAQNFSEGWILPGILQADAVVAPTGEGRVGFVDAGDIAAVAAAALTEDGHAKAEYAVTGPAALTFGEAAAIVAEASGRPVRHDDVSVETMAVIFRGAGLPEDYAEFVMGFLTAVANGSAAQVTDAVEQVTGRPATSFADYARGAADAWRPAG